MTKGKWSTFASRVYYALGMAYYLYQWIGIAGVFALIAAYLPFQAGYYWPSFVISQIALILFIWCFTLWMRSTRFQFQSGNPGIKTLETDRRYSVLDDNHYEYYRKVTVKAKQHGVVGYNHYFHWSGEGKIEVAPLDGCKHHPCVLRPHLRTGQVCAVTFERPLRKGETTEIAYMLHLSDTKGTAEPFLSHTCHDKTNRLTLRVTFPPGNQARTFKKQIFLSPVSPLPIWEETGTTSQDSNTAEFSISKPRVGSMYAIIW